MPKNAPQKDLVIPNRRKAAVRNLLFDVGRSPGLSCFMEKGGMFAFPVARAILPEKQVSQMRGTMVSMKLATHVSTKNIGYSLRMKKKVSLLSNRQMPKPNVVVRDVRDWDGHKLGRMIEPHDGTEDGVIAAARAATRRMYAEYSTVSNIESRICATDASGKPRWAVSPNFLHLPEIGTEEASYIWGLL